MRPRNAFILSFVICAICLIGASNISINADTRVFFSEGNKDRQALDLFEARYTPSVNLYIALHTKDGDVFTTERLEALSELTEDAWRLPYTFRVESISNATHVASDEDGIIITEAGSLADAKTVERVRERVMGDNLLVGRLIAGDGKTTAINVSVDYPLESSAATGEILAAAKAMIAQSSIEEAGFEAWYGGRVASSFAFSSASKTDLKTLIPITFVAFLILLVLLMRSVAIAGSLFLTAFLAAASTMGIAGWMGVQINAATAHVPTVIIALGVASLAHLAISVRRHVRQGESQDTAVTKALRTDARPIALTLCTTSVGFMTLNFADAPPFKQLGTLVSIGALMCLFYGLTLLPALLRTAKMRVKEPRSAITATINEAIDFIVLRRRWLAIGVPLLCVVGLFGINKISIDDTFPEYFTERFEFRRHADLIEHHLTGLEVLEFDIGGPAENSIYDPAYIAQLTRFESWLEGQQKVEHVTSLLEIFRRLNQHLTDGAPESRIVPDDRETLAQYILLYEMSLPMGQDLNNAITIDKSRSRVTAIMRDASTAEVKALKESAEDWLARIPPTEMSGNATGLAVMFAYLSSLNVKSMIGGTFVALVVISLILIFAFKSPRYGMMSLLPNLLPGATAFGIWGYLVGEVGVAVSVVGAITLGIIVDDTIHLTWRYREARNRGADPDVAARMTFHKVGEPMLISTIVLVAGFSVLATSGFHITSSTGILVAATIALALFLDWFLLAPLLILSDNFLEKLKRQSVERNLALVSAGPAKKEKTEEEKKRIAS